MKRSLWILVVPVAAVALVGLTMVAYAQRGLWSLGTEAAGAGAKGGERPASASAQAEESWSENWDSDSQASDSTDGPNSPVVPTGYDGQRAGTEASSKDSFPTGPGLDFRRFAADSRLAMNQNGDEQGGPANELPDEQSGDAPPNTQGSGEALAEDPQGPAPDHDATLQGDSAPPRLLPQSGGARKGAEGDAGAGAAQDAAGSKSDDLGLPPVPSGEDVPDLPAGPEAMESESSNAAEAASSQPASSGPAEPEELSDVPPVDASVLGPQTPSVTVEKIAPAVVNLGEPVDYEIVVRNVGSTPAYQVVVRDRVPAGTRLLATEPKAEVAGAELTWKVGTLGPTEVRRLKAQLQPQREGEIVTVAHMTLSSRAAARTLVAQPKLALAASGPPEVLEGDPVSFTLRVSNPGSGPATGVTILERLPLEFAHPDGKELEYEIGTLQPGESREVTLTVTAARRGRGLNRVVVTADGDLEATADAFVNIIAPQLGVNLNGPGRRYLGRPATISVAVSNPGEASAKAVRVVSYIPEGMRFVEASEGGQFDAKTGTVAWSLPGLTAKETASLSLSLVPTTPGQKVHHVHATAERGLEAKSQLTTMVEGVSAVLLEVVDIDDPVEVGAETTYEIRVVSQGSKSATNVRLVAELPEGMEVVKGTGPTQAAIDGRQVVFQPIERLGPGADAMFRVRARGLDAGDQRIRVQLLTDQIQEPIREEESTHVYAD